MTSLTMSVMTMNAEKLFEEMKGYVDAACTERNLVLAVKAAENLGLHNAPRGDLSEVFADLRHKDATGREVSLVAEWRDRSGMFQSLPDFSRISLTLRVPGRPSVEYTRF